MASDVELLAEIGGTLLECPTWDAESERLLWLDIPPRRLGWFEDREIHWRDLPDDVGSFCLGADDSLVLAGAKGIWRLPTLPADPALVVTVEFGGTTVNDGKAGPDGYFWFGTASGTDPGALFRCDTRGHVERFASPIGHSNGLGWSSDGRTMYHVDSTARRIHARHMDARGTYGEQSTFVTLAPGDGLPDGLCVDREGGVWVAVWGAAEVRRYDANGRQTHALSVPDRNTTSCCWAGPDLDELVITTARDEDGQAGGHVYRVRPGHRGVPVGVFELAGTE